MEPLGAPKAPHFPPCATGSRCREGRWCVWLPGSETPCGLQGEAGFWVWDVLEQSRARPTLQRAIHPPPKTTFGLGCVGRPPPHRAQRRKIRQSFKGCAGSAGTGGEKVPLLPARARDKLLLLQLLPKGQNQHHGIFLPLHVGSIAWIISRTWKTQSKAFAPF